MNTYSQIKKAIDELQIVYAEVYSPYVPDAHGEFMTDVEIMKMAHKFLSSGLVSKVDTNHDNKVNGSYVVESFIAREDDNIFIPGSWVVGVHIPSDELWAKVKSGEINGFSMEAMVHTREAYMEMEIPEVITGTTDPDATGHIHEFEVYLDDMGRIKNGRTNIVNGHFHNIFTATVTGPANGKDGEHTHRFSIVEELNRV